MNSFRSMGLHSSFLRTSLLMLLCLACAAQEQRFVYPTPAEGAFTKTPVIYSQSAGAELGMDLWRPTAASHSAALPILMIFNGFGGSAMRTSPQSEGWAKLATAHGFAAVTAETAPDQSADNFDAMVGYLAAHATELNLDMKRLAVIAWSGNVQDAFPVIEDPERSSIKAAVIYYGGHETKEVRFDLPVLFVRAGLDPYDPVMDRILATGLAANAPWTILNYPAGHHGFDVFDDNDASRFVIDQTFQFLQSAMADRYQAALRAGAPEAAAAGALRSGDYEKASALFAPLVDTHPNDARLRLMYGNALAGSKRYRDALVQYDRAKAIGEIGARDLALPAAKACLLIDDADGAIAWLKTIPPRGLPASLETDPEFAALKNRDDFHALFAKTR